MKDQLDVTCYFYFTSNVLNMFRTLIYPSSGACDCVVELPHRSSCSPLCVGDLVRLVLSGARFAGCMSECGVDSSCSRQNSVQGSCEKAIGLWVP